MGGTERGYKETNRRLFIIGSAWRKPEKIRGSEGGRRGWSWREEGKDEEDRRQLNITGKRRFIGKV